MKISSTHAALLCDIIVWFDSFGHIVFASPMTTCHSAYRSLTRSSCTLRHKNIMHIGTQDSCPSSTRISTPGTYTTSTTSSLRCDFRLGRCCSLWSRCHMCNILLQSTSSSVWDTPLAPVLLFDHSTIALFHFTVRWSLITVQYLSSNIESHLGSSIKQFSLVWCAVHCSSRHPDPHHAQYVLPLFSCRPYSDQLCSPQLVDWSTTSNSITQIVLHKL